MRGGYFVATSNVDEQFEAAGFAAERVLAVHGTLFEKDPYCGLYKAMFGRMARAARELAREAVSVRGVAA